MSEDPQQLVVVPLDVIAQPHLPLILAESKFMATLASLEAKTAELAVITNGDQAQLASDMQQRLTKAGKLLQDQRLAINKPFQDVIDKINAAAKEPALRIETAKKSLSRANTAFLIKQETDLKEAERVRQEELQKLEELAIAAEKAAAEKKAADEAQWAKEAEEQMTAAAPKPGRVMLDLGDDDDSPAPVPEPPPAPAAVAPVVYRQQIAAMRAAPIAAVDKPTGVKTVVTLLVTVTDVNLLADVFVTKEARMPAIRAAYTTGWKEGKPIPEVPGLKFEVRRDTISTGRDTF